jgi:hypothetical protein
VVHGLEAEYGDRINFVYLDVDDPANKALLQTLGRRSQPEFYLLDGEGTVLAQWYGRQRREAFEAEFVKVLQP